MEMRRFALPVVVGLFLAIAPAASAANLYSIPDDQALQHGSHGLPCNQVHPCWLYDAIHLASPGDDISLAPGTYNFADELQVPKPVTIHGDPALPRPFIKVADSTANAAFDSVPHTVLRHIEFTGVVRDCCATMILRDTTVEDSVLHGPTAGIFAVGAVNGTALRNTVIRLETTGVGGFIGNDGDNELRNVTISGVSNAGDGVVAACLDQTAGHVSVINSIVLPGAGKHALIADGRNCFHGSPEQGPAVPSINTHASSFDPLLVESLAGGMYNDEGSNVGLPQLSPDGVHELAGSQTIDAGKVDALSAIDIDNQARVMGAAVDIGADEFAPPPPAPTPTSPGSPTPTIPNYTSPIAPVILPVTPIPPGLTGLTATGTKSTSKVPPTIHFTISEARTFPFTVSALLPGRIRKGKCISPAGKKGKRCTSVRRLLEGTISAAKGHNDVALLADDSSQLSPGVYRVTLRPSGFGARSVRFRVTSGRKKS